MPDVCSTSPANNKFKPGFMAKLMLKDLRLSQAAAQDAKTSTPLGAAATAAFQQLIDSGFGDLDTLSINKNGYLCGINLLISLILQHSLFIKFS